MGVTINGETSLTIGLTGPDNIATFIIELKVPLRIGGTI